MDEYTSLRGKDFSQMLLSGAKILSAHREEVNDLNVFPIPDGDTGDNMLMTFTSGARAAADTDGRFSEVASAASSGMLLGARGNSGVILSRIFAGITRELAELETAELSDLKRSMQSGVKEAYAAVSKPVEGTILTVLKDAVLYAEMRDSSTIGAYFNDLTEEMARSLERTPSLLPALMEAGVVDSGGAGLLYIFQGMKAYLTGESCDEDELAFADGGIIRSKSQSVDFSMFTADSVLEFGYCTEFVMRLQNSKTNVEKFDVSGFIKNLEDMGGESIVAFKDGSIVKVHVHTRTPGDVFNFAQTYGEFLTMKVENMTFQNNEAVKRGNNAQSELKKKRRKSNAVVVVAAGAGVKRAFYESGADAVVDGGQSMNPSAQDFIAAFDEVNAKRIFVFPNNSNVVLTARQAAELYNKSEVVVIETNTVGECYAALSLMDTSESSDEIIRHAKESVAEVVTAYVAPASRDAETCGISVRSGDYIGFVGNEVYCDFPDRDSAVRAMVSRLNVEDFGVMIIFYGENADKSEAERLRDDFAEKYKNLEVILIDGGQPIYDYMLLFE